MSFYNCEHVFVVCDVFVCPASARVSDSVADAVA
jgi:hypothetical protein